MQRNFPCHLPLFQTIFFQYLNYFSGGGMGRENSINDFLLWKIFYSTLKERRKKQKKTLRIKKGRTLGSSPALFSQQIKSPINAPAIVSHLKNLIFENYNNM
jgi:hypothetical protein